MHAKEFFKKSEAFSERRTIGRTTVVKGAKLLFDVERGLLMDCNVRDITNEGAGIRASGLNLIPVSFELSFDNFRTARQCRLIWRDGDFLGVAFER